ncbi:MAG: permease-like cell division protein FtsX [Thermovenabulum sp.]|uniref:permease-like cell division protein FtsX n=2 Tax=Thermovenabulum sp. TaxID=3100335 RepID=UPI003C79D8BF
MKKEVSTKMKLRTLKYFFKEALQSLFRNSWMSVASIGAVASALIILGAFLMLAINVDYIAKDVESQVEITAYLKDGLNQLQVDFLKKQIQNMEEVSEFKFVSKEEAFEEFKKQVGPELLEGIENPLPNSIRIKVKTPQDVVSVAEKIKALQGIEEVKYGKGIVEKLFKITYWMRVIGIAVMLAFAALSVFIISNTIRITVFARRREIQIMKFIGATDWFVRWPFFIEGMILGLIGSIIAILILAVSYNYFYNTIKFNLPMISLVPVQLFYSYLPYFGLMGMFLGALGSGFSLKRFLKV